MKVLTAWLGKTDLNMARAGESAPVGPIAQALAADKYDLLLLLVNYPAKASKEYVSWLKKIIAIDVELFSAKLSSPTDFSGIYLNALEALKRLMKKERSQANLTFHLSPGTPAMGAVWIILGSTQYPATLIQSSTQQGVENANVPFEIAAEFNPGLLKSADQKQQDLNFGKARSGSTFGDIIYRSEEMDRVVGLAKKVAAKNVSVLIEGESGTGKELFANAIHNNSPRSVKNHVVVNCGAIASELFESEFFGHKKGSFTGAVEDRKGYFEEADGGTLFLDEIGDLPLNFQVKLLRALQEGEIKRIGENTTRSVDVRVITATNKSLSNEVAEGRFREDLYYRLNVWPLILPPLRHRTGDLGPLLDKFLDQINQESKGDPGYIAKTFSVAARNILLTHSWPGNVRELQSTIRRATLFADQPKISKENMQDAIGPSVNNLVGKGSILNRNLSEKFELEKLVDEVKIHYLKKVIKQTRGSIGEASKILGYKNYQSVQYALEKYKIKF
jgi:transcriptional regulator with GAF, ATPase, and Fis domain